MTSTAVLHTPSEEAAAAYWGQRWQVGSTGWRVAESTDVRRSYRRFAQHVLAAADTTGTLTVESLAPERSESADDAVDASLLLAAGKLLLGKRVFVPLCGDTPALDFYVEMGCHVVGVDCVSGPLETAFSRCTARWSSEGIEPAIAVTKNAETGETISWSMTTTTAARPASAGSLRLYCSDIFEWCEAAARQHAEGSSLFEFDVWHDRASLVALPPTLRERFVTCVSKLHASATTTGISSTTDQQQQDSCLGPTYGMVGLFTFVRRGEDVRHEGPPYHVSDDDCRLLFSRAASWQWRCIYVEPDIPATGFGDVVYVATCTTPAAATTGGSQQQ